MPGVERVSLGKQAQSGYRWCPHRLGKARFLRDFEHGQGARAKPRRIERLGLPPGAKRDPGDGPHDRAAFARVDLS